MAPATDSAAGIPPCRGRVVLLHGLGVNSWVAGLLAFRLRQGGYQVDNWGYSSFGGTLNKLIPHFRQRLREVHQQMPEHMPLFLVGHSLGAIILRGVLAEEKWPLVRRVVLLSPPHAGSKVATWAAPWLRWLTPLLDELSDVEQSVVNQLPRVLPEHLGVGTIAAEWDAVVAEASTRLGCETDHITMPSRHSGLLFRSNVSQQILHFLEHGSFQRVPVPESASVGGSVAGEHNASSPRELENAPCDSRESNCC